ncbi:uncharacterized protein J8A68_005327 [[Candida] subhashii]|uniref:Swi5-domain-containing protein n=1 Tax=[Candida] subhashii TaxID=561895 RepID=A0A8J5Q3G9_9ASCO|nr:uncharacterized protein J8A68_005327 [[Candida] subhashii]KAG7661154.1 hypothetical protein J8A68_005327 [[Candida] subhashii]
MTKRSRRLISSRDTSSSSSSTTPNTTFESVNTSIEVQGIPPADLVTILPKEDTANSRLTEKEKKLSELITHCSQLSSQLEGQDEPEVIIKRHIKQLNKYNELKDLALDLIGKIADSRQVRISEIFKEMGVDANDDD